MIFHKYSKIRSCDMSCGPLNKGRESGITFVSRLHAQICQRATHFAFAAAVRAVTQHAGVRGGETRECIGATVRASVITRSLASVANLHAQFRERAARLITATYG